MGAVKNMMDVADERRSLINPGGMPKSVENREACLDMTLCDGGIEDRGPSKDKVKTAQKAAGVLSAAHGSETAAGLINEGKIREEVLKDGWKQDNIQYEKLLTVSVEVMGADNVSALELMKNVRQVCGGLFACRATGVNKYEMTMSHPRGKDRLLDGFKIRDSRVMAKELGNDELVVSFLGLPAYVNDAEILAKLRAWGVSAVSAIRRRKWPGTNIADGTRFVKVKFNETIQSLPYSVRYETATGYEYFRVIHDNQAKCVCRRDTLRECL